MPRKLIAILGILVTLAAAGVMSARVRLAPLPADTKADLLVVEKGARRLSAYSHDALIRSYPVALGREPVGPKTREGDRRTPEGR
jgi:murein L,D-transpeptidase YafK